MSNWSWGEQLVLWFATIFCFALIVYAIGWW